MAGRALCPVRVQRLLRARSSSLPEPDLTTVLSQFVHNKPMTKAKWLCLHVFAALRSIENKNKKLMEMAGLKDRLGIVGNQFVRHVGQSHRVEPVVLRPAT